MIRRSLFGASLCAATAFAACTGSDPDFAPGDDEKDAAADTFVPGSDSGDATSNVDAGDAAPALEGKPVWSTLLGIAENPSVAVDANGNVFIAVAFTGQNHLFGDKSLTADGKDIAVLKLTSDGKTVTWARKIGGAGDELPTAISLDATGNVYVSGNFSSASIDIAGGATVTKGTSPITQGFVAKLSGANGDGMWGSGFTITQSANLDFAACVDVRSATVGIAFTCLFRGQLSYPGGTKTSNDRFSSLAGVINPINGSVTRAHVVQSKNASSGGETESIQAAASDLDADGNLYVTGRTNAGSEIVVDGNAIAGSAMRGNASSFLLKVKPSGSPAAAWARIFGPLAGSGGANARAVRVAGNLVHVAGTFSGSSDFGIGSATTIDGGVPADDLFLVQVDDQNTVKWQKSFGGPGGDQFGGLAVDPSGRPVVLGLFQNVTSAAIDGKSIPNGSNVLVATKIDPANGAALWVTGRAANGSMSASDIATSPPNGHAVAVGTLGGTVDFDKPLTTTVSELFVVDLSP